MPLKICRLCGGHFQEFVFRRTRSRKTLLIMLCVMLEKDKVGISYAQEMYNECKRVRKRICKNHYEETATYIGDEVAMKCENPVQNFFAVPTHVMKAVLAQLEPHRHNIDASCVLNPFHLAAFHRDFSEGVVRESLGPLQRKELFQSDVEDDGFERTESTSTEDVESKFMIPCDSPMDSRDVLELDETDPKLLTRHFRIKGRQLLKLFRFCPTCGYKISNSIRHVSLAAVGRAPIVHYICTACFPYEKRFEGREQGASSSREMLSESSEQRAAPAAAVSLHSNRQRRAEEFMNTHMKSVSSNSFKEESSDSLPSNVNGEVPPTSALDLMQVQRCSKDGPERSVARDGGVSDQSSRPNLMAESAHDCPSCAKLNETVVELEAVVQSLNDRVAELQNARLRQNDDFGKESLSNQLCDQGVW